MSWLTTFEVETVPQMWGCIEEGSPQNFGCTCLKFNLSNTEVGTRKIPGYVCNSGEKKSRGKNTSKTKISERDK